MSGRRGSRAEAPAGGGGAPPAPPPAPAGDHSYFYEDEVYRVNGRGQVAFGLVLDNCEGSSSDSDGEQLQRGDLRVVWHPSGRERVVADRSVGLADRALMPGDVVRRMIKGKDTQRGYCRDIVVTGAVQVVGSNLVLPAVPSERLQPLEEFTADLAVCLDSWVGTTKIVHSKLRLSSGDGSKLVFPDVNLCLLEDCVQRRRRGGRCNGIDNQAANEFYPGQTVVGPLGTLDHAVWSHTTKEMEAARKHKMREHKFTVECVETESVGVHWQCRALGEQAGAGPPVQPRFLVEGEDLRRLKLLNLFEPCTLQVGAKNFLTLTTDDTFCTKAQWKKTQNKIYRALRKQTRIPRSSKSKEIEPKESSNVSNASAQELNIPSNHCFRIPSKSKRRHSSYIRDGKICVHNLQSQTGHDNKSQFSVTCKETASESVKDEDHCLQSKMDVNIVIVDDAKDCLNIKDNTPNTFSNDDKKDSNIKASISPQRSDEGSHLDVPDKTCNGKNTSSDRSCSPENVERSEKQKKFRKTKVSSSNRSRSSSPAIFNGDHKLSDHDDYLMIDSDSWCDTSSDEGTDTDSCATWSSQCSSSTNNSMTSGRGKKSPLLVTKFLKGKRLKKTARKNSVTLQPKPGDRVVVETLCTKSKANVVWQDGTIEFGIPSTDLYPIHHLDGQECFPGDFVISGASSEASSSHRDYGVVQKVDHYGRTAIVKWFRTYTNCQDPVPQLVSESEVSVYDLKDHPDFQYRPGTVVIRVANFTGSEASCTAGQVMDNFPSGQVNVYWVDGHTSMCWPQDLYKVGEYDSDEGDIWADEGSSSEDSWETQSSAGDSCACPPKDKKNKETGEVDDGLLLPDIDPDAPLVNSSNSAKGELPKVPRGLEPRAAIHIERGLHAMARMEEILSQNPSLQSHEIMRKLLALYKDCRFLDRLMGTSFFHEDHFQGLLERVRERGGSRESPSGGAGVRRAQNQVLRLFSKDDFDRMDCMDNDTILTENKTPTVNNTETNDLSTSEKTAKNVSSIPDVEISHLETNKSDITELEKKENDNDATKETVESTDSVKNFTICSSTDGNCNLKEPSLDTRMLSPSSEGSLSKYVTPAGSMGDLTMQVDKSLNSSVDKNKNEDSGVDSQSLSISNSLNVTQVSSNCDLNNSSMNSETNSKNSNTSKASNEVHHTVSSTSDNPLSNRNVCLKLCSLITIQLMKACAEVSRRRNSLYVPFLNRLMNEKNTTGAKLPYRFSVQFDALVVTMTDEKEDDSKTKNPSENVDETEPKTSPILNEEIQNTPENIIDEQKAPSTVPNVLDEGFNILECAPISHRFRLSLLQPSEPRIFHQAVSREIKLLKSDLPPGVWVKGYEDRMDLLSIMIAGPAKTPYEDGLFLFDVQLGGEYPRAPPLCHYISYCSDRLNPNLYEDGKVCVSLLGTWSGRGVEVWGKDSSLLQVIVSLQGLILCAEPYFNEAGFEKQKGSQQGRENSRMYNEMVLLKLVQSLTKMIGHPPEIFKSEIYKHQSLHANNLCTRLTRWMHMSEEHNARHPESPLTPDTVLNDTASYDLQAPEYPLIPASRGFCLTLRSSLDSYRAALTKAGIKFESTL